MAFCGKCGQQNPDGASFCIQCGAPLMGAADAAPVKSPRQESASSSGVTRVPLRREATPPPPPRRESESESPRRQRESRREEEQPRKQRYSDEEEPSRRRRYRNEEEQPRRRRYRDEDEYDDDASEGGLIGNLVCLAKRSALMIAIGAVVMFLIMWLFS